MQDTMAEMAKEIKAKRTGEVSASADELFQFINKVGGGVGGWGWGWGLGWVWVGGWVWGWVLGWGLT